jgi:N-acetylglucosamine kinase-like BadF-type ATPase|tara:strand:- start:13460 stop:14431 length:972 start_codon:yes stop_codon:yes gene_type:complete
MDNNMYILGIDGGGTNTRGVIFNNEGKLLAELNDTGSNLYVYKENGVKIIINMVKDLAKQINIDTSDISALGFGLSGISDIHNRELLLKELDKNNLSKNSLILSDTEAAYQLLCPTGQGLLLSIGTGIICLAKNKNGKIFKLAGNGFDKGDIGSGYWIGKKIINKILFNQELLTVNDDIIEIHDYIKDKLNIENINLIEEAFSDQTELVYKTACISKKIINLAKNGNDIALSVLHEGTRHIGDYIIHLVDEMNFNKENIIIAGNGSIIKNDFYRSLIVDSLKFDFNNINWIFSDIPCSFSAGILAAQGKNIDISLNKIIQYKN